MADKKRKITLEDLIRSFTPSIPPKATTREQRATLLSTNYSTLREAASHPSLMVGDTESILSVTVKRLDQYDGPNDSDAFCEWALSEVVQPGVQRFIDFYKMKSEHSGAVRAGIWRILKGCTDLGFDNSTFAGIEANAWFTIFVGLDGFLVPGTAKLSTRLYEEGRYAGLTWRKTRLREAGRYASLRDAEKEQQAKLDKVRPRTRPAVNPDEKQEPKEPPTPRLESYDVPLDWNA